MVALYTTFIWIYTTLASVILGATIYEALVVHPAWSRNPPRSLTSFNSDPDSRLDLPGFWVPISPAYALSGIVALMLAGVTRGLETRLVISAICALAAVIWTLVYFRPTVDRLINATDVVPAAELPHIVGRWLSLNRLRLLLVVIAWWGAVRALAAQLAA